MSTEPKPIMSDEDFKRWERLVMRTQATLYGKYTIYTAKVVPAKPKPAGTAN